MPQFPAVIPPSTLDGLIGFSILGEAELDYSGISVSSGGDINGDGFDDIIIGSAHPGSAGAAYVVFGKAGGFSADVGLSSLAGPNGFQINGEAIGDCAGVAVSFAGDINHDGFDDVIVDARLADIHGDASGASYVVFGKASGFAANLNLSALDGTNGFQINRENAGDGTAVDDTAGRSVSTVGDVNGDGIDDLIIGSRGADPHGSSSGAAYVLFGKTSGFTANVELSGLNGANGFKLSGKAAGDSAGFSVSGAGDVNGDGIDDIIVGAPGTGDDTNPFWDEQGSSYVVFGKTTGFAANIDLSSLNGTNGFRIAGDWGSDENGFSVAPAGDVNGDGFDDLIVGSPFALPGHPAAGPKGGLSYVIFGKAAGFPAKLSVNDLNGANGFQILGEDYRTGNGIAVQGAGDVNGDGFDDLVIGAAPGSLDANSNAGAAYIVFGRASGFGSVFSLSSLDGLNGFKVDSKGPANETGFSVSSGDVNGDGYSDVIIGADQANGDGFFSGSTYVIFGHSPDGFTTINGTSGPDVLTGSGSDDMVFGFGGDDKLIGLAGVDTLDGGNGNDTLLGGPGDDSLIGGAGNDTADYSTAAAGVIVDLSLTDPQDTVGDGIDTLTGIENLIGSRYGDVLSGNDAPNRIDGGDGNDNLSGGISQDTLIGGSGNDTILGGPGNDTLDGGAGIDTVTYIGVGGGVTVHLWTTAAQNTGPAGMDTLSGFENAVGGDYNDYILGTPHDNKLDGGMGDDQLFGLGGTDTLIGGAGNDRILGGAGDDVLIGGAGNDTLVGDDGIDTASYQDDTAAVTVDLSLTTVQNTGGSGNDRLLSGIENLIGSSFGDTLAGDGGDNRIEGGGGSDFIAGGVGVDFLLGNEGDDTLDGGLGNDTLDGGAGIDAADYASAGGAVAVALTLSGPQDTGAAGMDSLIGMENLNGGAFDDRLQGSTGDNTLDGSDGADQLLGLGGNDTLKGGLGDDNLQGGNGSDTIIGGAGRDIIVGGDGDDIFVFATVADSAVGTLRDRINDFVHGSDVVDLSAIDANTATPAINDDFTFIGAAGFSNTAGELRFLQLVAQNQTVVEGDVNGNGTADFQIAFLGLHTFTGGDFFR
jgi:Ca2+-binding RTX toxin-like protein